MSFTRRQTIKRKKQIHKPSGFIDRFWGAEFGGERHQLMLNGKRANFSGPGTSLDIRLGRGDRGINKVDEATRIHDLDYLKIALSKDNNKEKIKASRVADKKLLNKSKKIGGFDGRTTNTLLKIKNMSEDIGIIKEDAFIGLNESVLDNIDDETDFLNSVFSDVLDFNKTLIKIAMKLDNNVFKDFMKLSEEQQNKIVRDTYPLKDFKNDEEVNKFVKKSISKM